jgi:hypothetical protein
MVWQENGIADPMILDMYNQTVRKSGNPAHRIPEKSIQRSGEKNRYRFFIFLPVQIVLFCTGKKLFSKVIAMNIDQAATVF